VGRQEGTETFLGRGATASHRRLRRWLSLDKCLVQAVPAPSVKPSRGAHLSRREISHSGGDFKRRPAEPLRLDNRGPHKGSVEEFDNEHFSVHVRVSAIDKRIRIESLMQTELRLENSREDMKKKAEAVAHGIYEAAQDVTQKRGAEREVITW
jgi:hypothetical protein